MTRDALPEPTPELLLLAYQRGLFPMARSRDDPDLFWMDPPLRAIMPIDGFHISRSLGRRIRGCGWQVTTDRAFETVMEGCASRSETWISARIRALYTGLFQQGAAHSLELWEGAELVGGVYGVRIGAAFFAESMFSRRRDASKVALAWLLHRLRAGGFRLMDVQYLTPHLASLGAVELTRKDYLARLNAAVAARASFDPPGYSPSPDSVSSPVSATGASG